MAKQILKGWVVEGRYSDEGNLYLIKNDQKEISETREISNLIVNALEKFGSKDLADKDEDFSNGISKKYIIENVEMQLFSSNKRMKLEEIKEKVILDSMGLLEFQENWYGYSEWTILGFNCEKMQLGGHDILEIIKSLAGNFVYLIIDVQKEMKR